LTAGVFYDMINFGWICLPDRSSGINKEGGDLIMNKGKMKKIVASAVVMLLFVTVLAGCANLEKKQAFYDYADSLKDDSQLWKDVSEASSSVSSARDMTTIKATVQAKVIPTLEKLADNAQQRNQSITDAEIKKIDDSYVKTCNNLLSAYKKILNGINNNDNSMMQSGVNDVNAAMTNMKDYCSGLQSFMNTYGIKDDGAVADMIKTLS